MTLAQDKLPADDEEAAEVSQTPRRYSVGLWHKLWNCARGLWYGRRFTKRGILQIEGAIRVDVRHGRLATGRCVIWPGAHFSVYGVSPEQPAVFEMGDHCNIGDRAEIHVAERITLGNNVIISWDCVLMDHDYHCLEGAQERIRPVVIEDDVWIGCRVIVLPGVRIGRGSVVGAGSVVTKDIPPGVLVAGNPAREIRAITGWTH